MTAAPTATCSYTSNTGHKAGLVTGALPINKSKLISEGFESEGCQPLPSNLSYKAQVIYIHWALENQDNTCVLVSL